MKNRVTLPVLTIVAFMAFGSGALRAEDNQSDHDQPNVPSAAVHWARGDQSESSGKNGQEKQSKGQQSYQSRSNPNMTLHGGPILASTQVTAIFWGTKWSDPNFAGDKITGLDSLYSGMGSSGFAHTTSEYYQNPNGIYTYVGDTINYGGSVVDSSAAAKSGSQTTPILTEVCKVITSPVSNGYYPVYIDAGRGSAGYCAWHSAGTCGGVPVQFAFFFNLDGDIGCDPNDKSNQGHTEGLAALANVSAHEISETRSDPRLNAWYDNSGQENADKCAWMFGSNLVTLSNGSKWTLQGNWSNKAYSAGTGYANSSGQKGCIDGANFK